MNRFLADTLNVLNAFAAIAIIFGSVLAGLSSAGLSGAVLAGILGVVIAGMFCGIISLLVLIEKHLRKIAQNEESIVKTPVHDRKEPSL